MPFAEAPTTAALPAREVLARSGADVLLPLLRLRMGFPPETFALAVQPLIDGVAACWQLSAVSGHARHAVPGGRVLRALERAMRALDLRRDRILPPHAAPEVLGALAHRWTFAVLAVAVLRGPCECNAEEPLRLYEHAVPESIQRWLAQDTALNELLHEALRAQTQGGNPIAQMVDAAIESLGPMPLDAHGALDPAVGSAAAPGVSQVKSDARTSADCADAAAPGAASGGVDPLPAGPAGDFLSWIREGLHNGSIKFNGRDALVHRVPEGLLLASPAIFRTFISAQGSEAESADVLKRLQRDVLKAGWHLRSDGGVTLHGYAWCKAGKPVAKLHGIVITAPQRLVYPLPPVNGALLRMEMVLAAPT